MALATAARGVARSKASLRAILIAAPAIFIVHFLEEAPGFVTWFNAHVERGITQPLFWSVNYTALAITVAVVALEWLSETALSAILAAGWLSCLMFANALFHVAGAVVDRAYVPGLATATLLYLPFFALVAATITRGRRLPKAGLILAVVVGALPMLAHGYLILFRGSRLF